MGEATKQISKTYVSFTWASGNAILEPLEGSGGSQNTDMSDVSVFWALGGLSWSLLRGMGKSTKEICKTYLLLGPLGGEGYLGAS